MLSFVSVRNATKRMMSQHDLLSGFVFTITISRAMLRSRHSMRVISSGLFTPHRPRVETGLLTKLSLSLYKPNVLRSSWKKKHSQGTTFWLAIVRNFEVCTTHQSCIYRSRQSTQMFPIKLLPIEFFSPFFWSNMNVVCCRIQVYTLRNLAHRQNSFD